MTNSPFPFVPFTQEMLDSITNRRDGETKLGQCIRAGHSADARFVLLGVCEDIGPQSNHGNPGAKGAFLSALTRFLNMQSNRRYTGEDMCIAGYIDQSVAFESVEQGRQLVEQLDDAVSACCASIFAQGQIPIVIGGGHNNAYPLIRSCAQHYKTPVEVVNLDPHADCRPLEGRHSGNPFSYAKHHGFLGQYTVLGLHAAYNSEAMLQYLNEQEFYYSYFEEYIVRPEKLDSDLQTIVIRSDEPIGIELDLDAIKFMPSSAFTPSGMHLEQARRYIMRLASSKRPPAYLHLPEGAPVSTDDQKIVGKAIAYLIHDFVSSCK